MNSLLHSNQPMVLLMLVFLAVFLLAWKLLFNSPRKPAEKKIANWMDSAESGSDVSEASLGPPAGQGSPDATSIAASGGVPSAPSDGVLGWSSGDAPDPSGIVAEVCSLQSPVREDVEQSYRGRRVRWTLSLSAIAETTGQGATHTVRMYPSGRSPYSCGVYFNANEAECAALQAGGRNYAFLVEGTIARVEDRDIDLTNVRMVEKAA